MTTRTSCAEVGTLRGEVGREPESRRLWLADPDALPAYDLLGPFAVPTIAESVEALIEAVDAPLAAAPALLEGLRPTSCSTDAALRLFVTVWRNHDARALIQGRGVAGLGVPEGRGISVDEYAKAVLYNGLGHYQAARAAAQRACARDDFALLQGALAELVEAGVRSGSLSCAVAALQRMEAQVQVGGSQWAMGVAACSRALLSDDESAEANYLQAIEWLTATRAQVALGRAHLLYGEWLRRRGRRVDAREQLTLAHGIFSEVGIDGFAERARRELLATGETARRRADDTRLDLTPQETQIAQLAAGGCTNPEIGERLFISPRTVEWHLRKVYTKLGLRSRRQLNANFSRTTHTAVSA